MPNPIVGLIATMFFSTATRAACLELLDCRDTCPNESYWCCTTGATGGKCPNGWTYNSATKQCTRSGSQNKSDTTGAYTETYGSCAAETFTCYEHRASGSAQSGCLMCH